MHIVHLPHQDRTACDYIKVTLEFCPYKGQRFAEYIDSNPGMGIEVFFRQRKRQRRGNEHAQGETLERAYRMSLPIPHSISHHRSVKRISRRMVISSSSSPFGNGSKGTERAMLAMAASVSAG